MPNPSDSFDEPHKKLRKSLTREQRQNISDALRRLWRDPAYREKILKAKAEGKPKERKSRVEEGTA